MTPRAVVAEDEPLLADALVAELKSAWPELQIVARAGDGDTAIDSVLELRPDVVFLDIRMPGTGGLDAAAAIAEAWPRDVPAPLVVFVTAYDRYAVEAFDRAAFDYLLKPVEPLRLARTCARLREALASRVSAPPDPTASGDDFAERLRALIDGGPTTAAAHREPPLRVIQAGIGNAVHLVLVADVVVFEAADKYVRVWTADREFLIRTALRDLLPRLDAETFWQVHRGTVVRADAIAQATRDEAGRVTLALRGRPEKLAVSRLYAGRFKAM